MKNENIFLKIWRIIYPMLLYLVISNAISIAAVMLLTVRKMAAMGVDAFGQAMLTNPNLLMEDVLYHSMLITMISAVITIPILYIFYRRDKKAAGAFHIAGKPSVFAYLWVAAAAIFFCIGINNLVSIINLTELFPGYLEVAEALYGGSFLIEILSAGIVVPIVEELIFRGLVHKRMRVYIKPSYAVILSSLLFGIYHMNVVQAVYAFLLGLAITYVYEKYQSMAAPILFHMAANLMSVISQETGILDWSYANNIIFIAVTILSLALGYGLLMVINRNVKVEIEQFG